jgi:hypothetical protein
MKEQLKYAPSKHTSLLLWVRIKAAKFFDWLGNLHQADYKEHKKGILTTAVTHLSSIYKSIFMWCMYKRTKYTQLQQ